MIEKLNIKDKRLIAICILLSITSLFITQRYFKQAFPEASINMDITNEEAKSKAEGFLANRGIDVSEFMHAKRFGYERESKIFLEYHLSAEEAGEILNNTNGYYWRNRWFKPKHKEEVKVYYSTRGELRTYIHQIPEDARGESLTQGNALNAAQFFLVGTMGIDIQDWELIESKTEKLKNRWDHEFEWKERSFNIKESNHILTVKVQGDQIGYYNERVKLPETWKMKYEKIRSKNNLLETIGFTGLFIAVIIIFIMILVRTREKDIHWKTAFTWSGIIAVLLIINIFNNYPLELYSYYTQDSYVAYLINIILFQCILLPLLVAISLGILIAGAEPFYRDQYPHQLSFKHILTVQGIKSRSFFNSAIIGISLTFLTFAFKTIFYLLSKEFGAWLPTETPNFDRLGTYVPWVSVLLGGLMLAIFQESVARMFAIPFLQKYTKSTILAVLISSVLWGISQGGISQPFYLRGLELTVTGIMISWIFLKYGILSTLIWSFNVDAVSSAMILLRSSNPYYFTTGIVSVGFVLLPLIYAIISYRKNGGFISSINLVNALDTEVYEESEETKKIIEQGKISVPYKQFSKNRVKVGLSIGILGILSFFAISTSNKLDDPIYNYTWLDKNRVEATEIAREYLLSRGFNLDGYRSAAASQNRLSPGGIQTPVGRIELWENQLVVIDYVLEKTSKDTLRSFLSGKKFPAMEWTVRFFKPETKREYRVWVSAEGDGVGYPHFKETLSDTAYLPFTTKEEALNTVFKFAENTDIELINMELSEEETIEKENRTDYLFKFKADENHKGNIAEARMNLTFEVHGNHVGMVKSEIKLPEAWRREYTSGDGEWTPYFIIRMFCVLGIFFALLIIGIRYLLKLMNQEKPNWNLALSLGAFVSILWLFEYIGYATHFFNYNTSKSINIFLFEEYFGGILVSVFLCLAVIILTLMINLAWPNYLTAFKRENRKTYLQDAFVSMFCSIGLILIISTIYALITIYHPTFFGPNAFKTPYTSLSLKAINSNYPFADFLLSGMVLRSFLLMLIIVGVFYIYRQLTIKGGFQKILVLFLIPIPFILPFKPELIYFFSNTLWIGGLFLLIRYFWRGNPWSYLFGVVGFFTVPDIIIYFNTIQDPTYRVQGIAAMISVMIFLLYFAREAFLPKTDTSG